MPTRKVFHSILAIILLATFFLMQQTFLPSTASGDSTPNRALHRLYQQMAALDGFSFRSTVEQTTHPLPTVANIGLTSHTDSLLVDGTIDRPASLTHLTLLEQSGNLLDGAGQIELKIDKGEVWGRVQEQEWKQVDRNHTPDPNSNEPSAFLQAAHNIKNLGVEERLGERFQRYSFEIDGPRWASLMQAEMQREMERRGELAPGQILDALEFYEKMSGQGTVWINSAGYLQRITLHAVYPPLPGESDYREVTITSDYFGWQGLEHLDGVSVQSTFNHFTQQLTQTLPATSADLLNAISFLFLFFVLLALPLVMVLYRRNLWLHRGVVFALVALTVIQPLLSAGSVQAASQRRETRLAQFQSEEATNDTVQEAIEQINAEFNSNLDLNQGLVEQQSALETLQAANVVPGAAVAQADVYYAAAATNNAATNNIDSDGDGLSDTLEATIKSDPAKKDSDGDGIDDGSEYNSLGLDPIDPDSDGDLLSDGVEITGKSFGGRTWYLNPQNPDSNNDGITDTIECIQAVDVVVSAAGKGTKGDPKGTGICDDTDSDGIPDFADDDNDNDLVWDWLDGQAQARFGDTTSGVKEKSFQFGIDNYSAGKPLRLTFELRPTNPQHLWYSMNVLDWPADDFEGQIRRVKDTKIGSSGSLANGDMQLVPMLEVTLPAAEAAHLPSIPGKQPVVGDNTKLAEWLDMPTLERYQMAVSWTQDKQSLRIYLPATLIRDSKGNAPLNFVAKLLYVPNGSGLFSSNHTARLVWLVQLDTDRCVLPESVENNATNYNNYCTAEGKQYENGKHWVTSKQQIVHRYYDSFYLNAFTAETDLGANTQLFYESPALVANPASYVPDQLLGLSNWMELYLRQNKTPSEALQAYRAKTPAASNRLTNTAVIEAPETYGLVSKVATQETPNLLESVFKAHKETLPYPTMLFVTWGKSKVNGLSGIVVSDTLKIDMNNGTQKSGTSIRLGSFTYNPNPSTIGGLTNPNWNPVDPGTLWQKYLKNQSVQAYQTLPTAVQQKIDVEQFQQSALSLYWNVSRGVEVSADFESTFKEANEKATGMIDEFSAAADNGGNNAIAAMIGVLDDFAEAKDAIKVASAPGSTAKLLAKLSGKDIKNAANIEGALKSSKWAKGIGTAAVSFAGLSATLSVVLAFKDQLGLSEGMVTALEGINASMGAVLAGLQIAQEVTKVVQAVQAFSGTAMQGLKSALAFSNESSKAGTIIAIIVVAVIVIVALVIFFKLLSDGNPVAAKTALAQGVATAVVVLILFVIGIFFPIGTAIALIAGLIDGIFTAICKLSNWIGGKDKDGKTFEDRNKTFCSGIVGNTVAALAGLFYRSKPMVDMGYSGRLQFGQTDTKLIEQNGLVGMSANNKLEVKQQVTVTVRIPSDHALKSLSNSIAIDGGSSPLMPLSEYDRLIKQKSYFNFELVTATDAAETDALKKPTADAWKSIGDVKNRDRLYKEQIPTLQITLTAGINWKPALHVREYVSFPLAECGFFAGGCDFKFAQFSKTETSKKEILNLGKNIIYDVFPATLTDFYTLEQVQENGAFVNRYRLGWGGKDKPFPVLMDADGDGLRSDGTGALDPDDKTGDKDNDGLPDAFEMQDYRLNVSASDSDNDGLSDYNEIRYGTRPDRADSDNDGLNDGDEINGWEFVYVDADGDTKRTWVTADPRVADSDGDGFSDQQERVFGFHPRARTLDPKILSIRTSTNQSSSTYLGPQQSINFTSTVKNELRKPIAYGLLEAEILNSNSAINPVTFELQPQQSTNVQGTINVPATPPSPTADEITLRNRAGANLVDPAASYASLLQGLAQPNGLKFHLNFEQRPASPANFQDVTGNVSLTCDGSYCPSVVRATDSYGSFRSGNWYVASGNTLAFAQAKFSLGGWVTLQRAFGGKYSERVLLGPDNVAGTVGKYLQLSVVDLASQPKAKISFTATDGSKCEQVLSELTLAYEQKSHIFVTYDGTAVRGFKNGVEVGSYNLQNCANKIPDGNRFTLGRGQSHATLYISDIYFDILDEGGRWNSGEPYMQLNDNSSPFWSKEGVKNGRNPDVNNEQTLRDEGKGDSNSTVYICEEDRGDKSGQCRSDSSSDSDDFHGTVTIDPRTNRAYDSQWSSGEGNGQLRYNVQNNFFHGDLDDLRIYEATLNAREISQIVNGGGLLYQLDEASGRTQFRNAGTDSTQVYCLTTGNCPTSGLKGYSGQAVRFGSGSNQTLAIDKLNQRFGSNFVVSFWIKPEATATNGAVPLIRSGQGTQGYTLYANNLGSQTALNSRFMFAETGYGTIGGSGGSEYNLRCNSNEALVGLYGGAGGLVDRVGATCVPIDAAGTWVGEPRQIGTAGGNGGSDFDYRCERNSAIVSFRGRSGNRVDQLTLSCARLGADGYADTRNRSTLASVGGSGGSAQDERVCPSNLPADGIRGRAGGLVDAFGLLCRDGFSGNARTLISNGQWSHIALVQREETVRLYINGQAQQEIWFGAPSLAQYRVNGSNPDLQIGSQLPALLDEIQIHGIEKPADDAINAQVAALYQGSAVAYVAFDDVAGSNSFVNSTGKGNLTCANPAGCPQAGIKGQVRESVLFTGAVDAPVLTISDQRNAGFAFSAWVKLPSLPDGIANLVTLHEDANNPAFAWRLQLANRSGKLVPQFTGRTSPDGNTCSDNFEVTLKDSNNNDLALALNQWYHIGVSYNPINGSNDLSVYLNGQLAYQQRMSGLVCRVGTALRLGQSFKGQMDEFSFYAKPLVLTEFLSHYVYQNTWYDVVTHETFKVDYIAPTVKVTSNSFLKAGTTIFGVAVSDAESGIKLVEYQDNDGTWKAARSETATSGVWAFALDVQGSKSIEVRATDTVGNVRTDSKQVSVDNTAPTVQLTTTGKQKELVAQGTVADSGSGFQSATIMLIDALGSPFSAPRDLPVVNGAWSYTQELPPLVNGTFKVWASAVDQVGNRFEGIIGSIQVDNAAPVVSLLTDKIAYGGIDSSLPTLRGYVSDAPYPDGMKLFIGFEELSNSGTISKALDMAGNQWQVVPQTGGSAPTIDFAAPQHRADFQIGQSLVISNANPLFQQRTFVIDPNSATLSLWINPTSVAPAEQKLIHQEGTAGFGVILKGDQVTLRINRDGAPVEIDTGKRVVAGTWQLLTLSLNRSSANEQSVTTWLDPLAATSTQTSTSQLLSDTQVINLSTAPWIIGAASNGFVGKLDDLVVYARPLSDLEVRQLVTALPSAIQKVEIGILHRQDRNDPSKLVWKEATLANAGQSASLWSVELPAGLEGIYDLSLRTSDAISNQRVLGGVWTGVLDTLAPRIALSGTVAGTHQCLVSDFSLGTSKFICADAQDSTGASSANFTAGTLGGLTWETQWFHTLFSRQRPPNRLYALQLGGRDLFAVTNSAESCDIYGNCARCVVSDNNLAAPACTVYAANAQLGALARASSAGGVAAAQAASVINAAAEEANTVDDQLTELDLLGPEPFSVAVTYERPDAYVPGTEPGSPTSSWEVIEEPYTLIDDAVLASTRPFAASFVAAHTAIEWGESVSATQYYVGWTLTETAVISDLTVYASSGIHTQTLADKGRYYAHVVAVDVENEEEVYTLGPIYFDGATPASYLNWDEYGAGDPYELWQDAQSATGQSCNLLGVDDRVSLFTNGTSPRSGTQFLYGTWNNDWLAIHWNGVNINQHGDLHLYLDSKAGGAIHAFDPYSPIERANSLVILPERRNYQSDAVDRMMADYAVIVEDDAIVRLLEWNGSTWQDASTAQIKFSYAEGETVLWLPLSLLGINPAAVDLSLVGFATEENAMQLWATMPGNNPLNSVEMLPEHALAANALQDRLVNLQTSMRLSANPAVNNTLDNCPTNVLFDQSLFDIDFSADPAGEVYDPVLYEGIRAAVPDDVEPLLASLCAGVGDSSNSAVCQLAQEVAANIGGAGPEVGPNGLYPASAGPNDELVYYATVRNLSFQDSGVITLEVESTLPINGAQLAVGILAPFESRVISISMGVDAEAAYIFTEVSIFPIEEVENSEEDVILSYSFEPHTVIHDIDRSAPFSAELTSLLIDDTVGTGELYLDGVVWDQSPMSEVKLQTSLGETVTCDDTVQIDTFQSDWFCAINIPAGTPDGTVVIVQFSATDIYGFASGVIATWQLAVDNTNPEVMLLDQLVNAAGIAATSSATETMLLEGVAGDDRVLAAVEVCDLLQGYESCTDANLYVPSEALSNTIQAASAANHLADEVYWVLERSIDLGLDKRTVPFTITAYDAFGNSSQQALLVEIDTKAPSIALDAQPVSQIAYQQAFALSGSAQDNGGVSEIVLEVINPLGEYEYYTVTLTAPGATTTQWRYELPLNSEHFAMPGTYHYLILAYDELGNEAELGSYSLQVGEPAEPLLNDPFFANSSNDLWTGFAPGASLYMKVFIDDADIEAGDTITVTANPIPDWLTIHRLDIHTFEVTGTVPLTITELLTPTNPVTDTEAIGTSNLVELNLGVLLEDSTGRQAFNNWKYSSDQNHVYLPVIHGPSEANLTEKVYLPVVSAQ